MWGAMAYIVYITEDCQEEAKDNGFVHHLQREKDSIEKKQTVVQFERYGSSKYSKKKFGSYQGRLITYEDSQTIDDKEYVVIIFLTIFIKGSNEYKSFIKSPSENGKKFLNKIDQNNYLKYLKDAIAENPPVSKPHLSEYERAYLFGAGTVTYDFDNETVIYESDQWVKAINQKPFSSMLSRILDTIKSIYEKSLDDVNECQILQRNEKIVFCLDKSKKRLSLINLITQENSQAFNISDTVEKWNQDVKDSFSSIKRAYPQYILAEEDFWMDIEKDPQSNYVLSDEEIEILNNCTTQKAFPLFINGRAGSGKSTMLQYLFADYFSRYISYIDGIKNPPVYFTYNPALLMRAKNFVKGLINCNSAFGNVRDQLQQDDRILGTLEESFKELKVYLLSIVPASDSERFDDINYINFTIFRERWMEKFRTDKNVMRNYSPDISWHIIRTYIQGMNADGYMEPEDYDELEEKQKTVSKDVYEIIYNKVWKWYKEIKQERKLWDDQDLARYIIENDLARPLFPGVFCDEAQDFTRVDMEVIFRLSLYSNRELQKQDISTIPFAFAGDEFQTLNPTGFRWEALKAGFTQKFILSLSAAGKEPIQTNLNYFVLEKNYRSQPPIVKFCNTLQLFRAVRFNNPGLHPQEPWNTPSNLNVPVLFYHANDAVFWEKILKIPATVFIIPCDDGQELKWIKEDQELSKYIVIKDGTPANVSAVLSANVAKGSEFDRVVVYGFGKDCPERMINSSENEDTSVTLPLEYYINKTYVAISRAKTQLYIVDSEEGIKKLWEVTKNEHLIKNNIEKINTGNTKYWSLDNHLYLLTYGQGYSALVENSEINMEELALQLTQIGMSSRSSLTLKMAANNYRNLKLNNEANKFEAIAYVFDKKYFEAGSLFAEAGRTDDAINAFWLANSSDGFNKIVSTPSVNISYPIFCQIALSMISDTKENILNAIKTLATKKTILDNAFEGDDIFISYDMREVLTHTVNTIIEKLKPLIDINSDGMVLDEIIDIQKQRIKVKTSSIAEIAYTLNDYRRAMEYWEKSEPKDKEKNNIKYNTSKAYSTKYPDNIALFKTVKMYDEIINQYNENENVKLSEEQLSNVAEAFLTNKEYDKTLLMCSKITSPESFQLLININDTLKDDKQYGNIFLVLKKISLIRKEVWNDIWHLIEDERNTKKKTDTLMLIYIAAALARLDSWSSLPETGYSPSRRDISEFLKEEISRKYINRTLDIPDELLIDIGTAIERAGFRIDALEYYEYIESCIKNEEIKLKSVERWIKVKERQAELSNDGAEMVERRKREAINKRKFYNIPENKDFIEYEILSEWSDLYQFITENEIAPLKNKNTDTKVLNVPSKPGVAKIKINNSEALKPKNDILDNSHSHSKNLEYDINGFNLSYFYLNSRLNITSKSDGKTISITSDDYASNDYSVVKVKYDEVDYQHIKGTSILFQNKGKIEIYFKDTKDKMYFNE